MTMRRLLRLPGASCPPEALTGDEVLDAYIMDLDSRLLGSKYVRLLTTAEIRDHLEEAKARGVAAGLDARAAAEQAVSAVGPAEDYAREQRAALRARFWKMGGIAAVIVATVTGVFQLTSSLEWVPLRAIITSLFFGAVSGFLMAATATYRWPQRWIGVTRTPEECRSTQFDVTYPRPLAVNMILALIAGAVFILPFVVIGVIGVIEPNSRARAFVPLWFLAFDTLLAAAWIHDLNHTPRSLSVRDAGFWVRSWTGLERDVLWQNVLGATTYYWTPTQLFSRRLFYIEYRSMSGRKHRIPFRRDLLNADRLLQLVEEHAQRNRTSGKGAACAAGAVTP